MAFCPTKAQLTQYIEPSTDFHHVIYTNLTSSSLVKLCKTSLRSRPTQVCRFWFKNGGASSLNILELWDFEKTNQVRLMFNWETLMWLVPFFPIEEGLWSKFAGCSPPCRSAPIQAPVYTMCQTNPMDSGILDTFPKYFGNKNLLKTTMIHHYSL